MPRPRALTVEEARRALANRLGPRVDRVRQFAAKLGVRPYRCFLVWTKFSGDEIGDGKESVVREQELLPTPNVLSLDDVTFSPFSAGVFPEGAVMLDLISVGYTYDQLTGHVVPEPHEAQIPEPYNFYYELREDGRGDRPPERQRYRVLGVPFKRAGRVCWVVRLERQSGQRRRNGLPQLAGHGSEDD